MDTVTECYVYFYIQGFPFETEIDAETSIYARHSKKFPSPVNTELVFPVYVFHYLMPFVKIAVGTKNRLNCFSLIVGNEAKANDPFYRLNYLFRIM